MAMWNMLGQKPVDVVHFEAFSKTWQSDVKDQLKLNPFEFTADPGKFPDVSKVNKDHDLVFAQNGTTSGVKIPNFDWISEERTGLTFNDATSGIFSQHINWNKVDVLT